jgi:hypothetical protein
MEVDSYANACMMHACMSRLHQGCVLLSGFAQLQKKIASFRDPLHHASRARERTSCATALYDLSISGVKPIRSCSIAANKSPAAL